MSNFLFNIKLVPPLSAVSVLPANYQKQHYYIRHYPPPHSSSCFCMHLFVMAKEDPTEWKFLFDNTRARAEGSPLEPCPTFYGRTNSELKCDHYRSSTEGLVEVYGRINRVGTHQLNPSSYLQFIQCSLTERVSEFLSYSFFVTECHMHNFRTLGQPLNLGEMYVSKKNKKERKKEER